MPSLLHMSYPKAARLGGRYPSLELPLVCLEAIVAEDFIPTSLLEILCAFLLVLPFVQTKIDTFGARQRTSCGK